MGYIYGVLPPIVPPRPHDGIRPVKPHITLVKIKVPVRVELKYRRFVATTGRVLLLPSAAKPRYIALRVEPQGEFAALRTLLISTLGSAVEEKYGEFKPHLTLYAVRIKRPTKDDLAPAIREAKGYVGVAFEVKAIHLIDTTDGLYMPLYSVELHA